ncbi:DUF1501 domain-containing protein [Teredinibacter waterburyi]|jgi:Uncharacterized protein conserved in bacteria|uniref:DUF1501 domain-containing protein n=1 Tax=Teredinibacter waterburyi TaxID=1500538 RepID=UPI00165F9409|nr:DUF1501 domain-containing protein [Teredinibacter waterburyi]
MKKFKKSNYIETLNRRHFLRNCSALALGSSCALGTLGSIQLAHAQTAPANDYKALVCIFLFGGNDAFNMLIPRSTSAYTAYANARQGLAKSSGSLIPISASRQSGADYGLHPALTDVNDLYLANKLSFVGNVGALVEPVSKIAYQAKTVALPPQLFSHNDQQNFIQSLQSTTRRNGWAGRAADILSDMNTNQRLSMNISLSGSNLWQSGAATIPYAIDPSGLKNFEQLDRSSSDERMLARIQAYENILQQGHNHTFANAYAESYTKAWDLTDEVGAALTASTSLSTNFPSDNRMASSLKMAAQMIAARNELSVSRQTFFIGVGDFDTHGDQNRRHDILMSQLNDALKSFYDATVELGVADKVTTFTASDFGRTLSSNGDGTDHGWGSHQIVMGDAVAGGDIYGTMPDLTLNSDDDMGEGRIIPTTSMDQYSATLAKWYGVPGSSFADIFPNLSNFDSTDLGFIKA